MSKIFSLGFSVSVKCVILVSPGDLGPRRTGDTVGQVLLQAKFYCRPSFTAGIQRSFPAGQGFLQAKFYCRDQEKRERKKRKVYNSLYTIALVCILYDILTRSPGVMNMCR